MRRRELLVGLSLVATLPGALGKGRTARVGVMLTVPLTAAAARPLWQALVEGLRGHGWEEGKNLVLEGRFANQDPERFHEFAAELVALKVDAMLAANAQSIEAARRTTSTIPIVMISPGDPVRAGLIASLARPGGNITGLAMQLETVVEKHVELLKELRPGIERVGVLYSPDSAASAFEARRVGELGPGLGLMVLPFPVSSPADVPVVLAAIARERPHALHVHAASVISAHRPEIAAFAIAQRLPTITGLKALVPDGVLMSYAPNLVDMFRRAAWYLDQILRGAHPAELPVEQASRYELVINLRTAKALGLTIPPNVLARADEVIE